MLGKFTKFRLCSFITSKVIGKKTSNLMETPPTPPVLIVLSICFSSLKFALGYFLFLGKYVTSLGSGRSRQLS